MYDVSPRVVQEEEHWLGFIYLCCLRKKCSLFFFSTLVPLFTLSVWCDSLNQSLLKPKNNKIKGNKFVRPFLYFYECDCIQVESTLSINCQIIDVETARFVWQLWSYLYAMAEFFSRLAFKKKSDGWKWPSKRWEERNKKKKLNMKWWRGARCFMAIKSSGSSSKVPHIFGIFMDRLEKIKGAAALCRPVRLYRQSTWIFFYTTILHV